MKNKYLISILVIFLIIVAINIELNDHSQHDIGSIKHVVIIMQENRAFDSYFGTYPGVDGIPNATCIPDEYGKCMMRPYHDSSDINQGGPHSSYDATVDIDNGKMDGFLKSLYTNRNKYCRDSQFKAKNLEYCIGSPDVMGYHDSREIPNYWRYANEFVLQDHMFESVASWTLPSHLFLVSSWSADCENSDPMSCNDNISMPKSLNLDVKYNQSWNTNINQPDYSWTDITYLLYKNNVSWKFYYGDNDGSLSWFALVSPLPWFQTVKENRQIDNIQPISRFFDDLKKGDLPSVIWIVPNFENSEHPPASIKKGEAYVTNIVNTIMKSPEWYNSAIFVSWDDWGGFYDHVVPPKIDKNGYGLRVPGLVISPYAKKGYIDHQNLSHDAYLKFIEDIFLNKKRIDPKSDGRSDRRPSVRENVSILGDLKEDFDFHQSPRKSLIIDQ
jgi:phospholipase C